MRTVLITAYAIHPLKGSEDGMGWNYVVQAARNNRVIAVTRKNNRPAIENYIARSGTGEKEIFNRIQFLYFDWPKWMILWKKGPMLSMIYYYMWQLTLAIWLRARGTKCDIAHNLNFHNDWTPSFLWLVNRNFVWGPVGHHPSIPHEYIKGYGRKEVIKDRMLWAMKWCFWNLDPLLFVTRKMTVKTWCMHSGAVDKLRLRSGYMLHPSIAATSRKRNVRTGTKFNILSVGRFVPLKGFDITIRAFARFCHHLPEGERKNLSLVLVGKGPERGKMERLIRELGIQRYTHLVDWVSQDELNNIYRGSHTFLFPSHEGAGMVVAEAMSYGLPVVCWNNLGPGYITHPNSKLKVEYNDYDTAVSEFAEKLERLYKDQTYYSTEADMAYDRFTAALSWDSRPQFLNQLYDEIPTVPAKTKQWHEETSYCNTLAE